MSLLNRLMNRRIHESYDLVLKFFRVYGWGRDVAAECRPDENPGVKRLQRMLLRLLDAQEVGPAL